jgi:hypothetical protein
MSGMNSVNWARWERRPERVSRMKREKKGEGISLTNPRLGEEREGAAVGAEEDDGHRLVVDHLRSSKQLGAVTLATLRDVDPRSRVERVRHIELTDERRLPRQLPLQRHLHRLDDRLDSSW